MKICASSRPRRVYETFIYNSVLHGKDRTFNIADFTKNDMRVSVHERLHENQKFKGLAYNAVEGQEMNQMCKGIIDDISKWANGV